MGSIQWGNTITQRKRSMANDDRARGWLCAVASAALLAVSATVVPPASAQDTGLQISSDAAQKIDLSSAPEVPAVAPPAGLPRNRPPVPLADYVAAQKAPAAPPPGQAKPRPRPPRHRPPATLRA